MSDLERIPAVMLAAVQLRFCRRVATALIEALALSGQSYEDVERRLKARRGWAKRLINGLIDGTGGDSKTSLRDIADFATACECDMQLAIIKTATTVAPVPLPTDGGAVPEPQT